MLFVAAIIKVDSQTLPVPEPEPEPSSIPEPSPVPESEPSSIFEPFRHSAISAIGPRPSSLSSSPYGFLSSPYSSPFRRPISAIGPSPYRFPKRPSYPYPSPLPRHTCKRHQRKGEGSLEVYSNFDWTVKNGTSERDQELRDTWTTTNDDPASDAGRLLPLHQYFLPVSSINITIPANTITSQPSSYKMMAKLRALMRIFYNK